MGGAYHILASTLIKAFEIEVTVASGWTCIIFITVAIILTGLGVFDNLVTKYKFGLIIPITGFAHSVASSILDNKKDGFITGMGANMFKLAGAVILYGTVSSFILTLVKVVIYG